MSASRIIRRTYLALLCAVLLVTFSSTSFAAGLEGHSVSADMQPLVGFCEVMNQLQSPQTVVNPGKEFLGGLYTPNAAGASPEVKAINSFGMELDLFPHSMQLITVQTGIAGFSYNFGPVLRVNVTDLAFDGEYLTGITQTSGGGAYSASLTSPTSIAIDLQSFGPGTQEFQFLTTVPEPHFSIPLIALMLLAARLRFRQPHLR